jgi:hypothetical protein
MINFQYRKLSIFTIKDHMNNKVILIWIKFFSKNCVLTQIVAFVKHNRLLCNLRKRLNTYLLFFIIIFFLLIFVLLVLLYFLLYFFCVLQFLFDFFYFTYFPIVLFNIFKCIFILNFVVLLKHFMKT